MYEKGNSKFSNVLYFFKGNLIPLGLLQLVTITHIITNSNEAH